MSRRSPYDQTKPNRRKLRTVPKLHHPIFEFGSMPSCDQRPNLYERYTSSNHRAYRSQATQAITHCGVVMRHASFAAKLQWQRSINYEIHFSARTLIKTLPAEHVESLAQVALLKVPFPLLNVVGACFDGWMPENIQKIIDSTWPAQLRGLFNPFYLSESGWDGFQILWKNLPEPECAKSLIIYATPKPRNLRIYRGALPGIALLSRSLTLAG